MSSREECYLTEVGYAFMSNNGKGFHRGDYIPYRALPVFLKSRGRIGCFCTAYRYNNTAVEQSDLYGDLYLDLDDEDNFENVRDDALRTISYFKIIYKIPENELKIYFSGKKGIHILVPAEILGIQPMPLLNGVFKYIANSVNTYSPHKTIDMKIYDNKRMFRVPNTKHESTGLYKIPITADELRNLSIEEIRKLAESERRLPEIRYTVNKIAEQAFQRDVHDYYIFDKEAKKDKRFASTMSFVPPCIQYMIENGAVKGERNVTIACLASFYKSYGVSKDEAIDTLLDWNMKNAEPTPEAELKRTVQSLYTSNKTYGCQTLAGLSVCDTENCKISKYKKERKNNDNQSKGKKDKSKCSGPFLGQPPSSRSRPESLPS